MGPITPNDASQNHQDRVRKLKWIDNNSEATQGPKLISSFSKDDLIVKEREGAIPEVTNYKRESHSTKSAIKKFILDYNSMTGIPNF